MKGQHLLSYYQILSIHILLLFQIVDQNLIFQASLAAFGFLAPHECIPKGTRARGHLTAPLFWEGAAQTLLPSCSDCHLCWKHSLLQPPKIPPHRLCWADGHAPRNIPTRSSEITYDTTASYLWEYHISRWSFSKMVMGLLQGCWTQCSQGYTA